MKNRRHTVRHHIAIDRSFWLWAVGGTVMACAVGALYAVYLQQSGKWAAGLHWEVVLLEHLHVSLPPVLDWFLLALPWLGTNITILPGVLIAAWLLWKRGRRDLIVAIVVGAVGNHLVGTFLKYAFDRPRPALWPARGEFTGPSYPSGHAMMVTSVLFVFAYLLRRERGWRWPYVVCTVFALITSYSRLYLGVHWPTDVIGGAIIGAVWLSAMLRAMDAHADELFEIEHRVPQPGDAAHPPNR
jgi:membrane-associated phospholipid phosphatase